MGLRQGPDARRQRRARARRPEPGPAGRRSGAGATPLLAGAALLAAAALVTGPAHAAPTLAPAARADLGSGALVAAARALAPGGVLVVEGVALDGDRAPDATLTLERFAVFAPDARVRLHREDGQVEEQPPPANVYLRGRVDGDAASRAFVTVREHGAARGLVYRAGRAWVLDGGTRAREAALGLALREIDLAAEVGDRAARFACDADALETPPVAADVVRQTVRPPIPARRATARALGYDHTARVAVETDHELFERLGGATETADYVGDVFAHATTIYEDEIRTSLAVGDVDVWATRDDPWTQTSPTCGLYEFGRHWNETKSDVPRTIAHFLSGKPNGGGVAWVGVLCDGGFYANASGCGGFDPAIGPYGGAYGLSGDLDGSFSLESPGVVWDIVVVAHEIGHNFDSPHAHCYAGLEGDARPVDTCYAGQCGTSGCHCGDTSLPGPAGEGAGTLMSYCHLKSPGYANLSLTFGSGHPWGVAPERVPARMRKHVAAQALGDAACLAPLASDALFADGFEDAWLGGWPGRSTP